MSESQASSPRPKLSGEFITPADEGFDATRQAWNLAVDQRPEAVAIPADVADVQEIVRFAREAGLRVAVQGTGHNAGAYGPLDGTILVRTIRLNGLEIDGDARTARAGAATLWGEVTPSTSELGLAPVSGSSIDVGVVGYTLGGGLSWLGRKHGLASSHVKAVELVTADGEHVRADADNEPDLFWALRGGGGSFGAVTAIEFGLLEVPELYAGMLAFPWERAGEVLGAWRTWLPSTPEELTSVGRIMQFPPFPEVPEMVRGRKLAIVEAAFLGAEAEGAGLLAPLRELGPEIDTFAAVPPVALSRLHMDPEQPVPGMGDHRMLGEIPAEAIEAMVAAAGHESGSPLLSVELRQLGGALGRPDPAGGALDSLRGEFVLFAVGIAADPELAAATGGHLPVVMDAMAPWDAGCLYANFTERPVDVSTLFSADARRRLGKVKSTYDPDGLFRGNHDIAAA
jgi:hypothetical protein